uniref:NADH-ubiquinone oxidoreductase chain 6 n=1 Tax=Propalticus sp. PRO01 TaxID=1205574 RepID=A0A0S2MQH0_9CUCU|nr:NADH deshydrogenase subunit 6 [Propalticus sp. PRO01]
MILNFFLYLMCMLSLIFILLNHPLSFGLILLSQTITISMITGMMSMNFWYSYLLTLIMIGGMLILFLYMTSIASNEKFKFSIKITIFFMMMSIILLIKIMQLNNIMEMFNEQYTNFTSSMNIFMNMSHYFNMPLNYFFLFMIMYLLISLIAIVKITNIKLGPIRQSN